MKTADLGQYVHGMATSLYKSWEFRAPNSVDESDDQC